MQKHATHVGKPVSATFSIVLHQPTQTLPTKHQLLNQTIIRHSPNHQSSQIIHFHCKIKSEESGLVTANNTMCGKSFITAKTKVQQKIFSFLCDFTTSLAIQGAHIRFQNHHKTLS